MESKGWILRHGENEFCSICGADVIEHNPLRSTGDEWQKRDKSLPKDYIYHCIKCKAWLKHSDLFFSKEEFINKKRMELIDKMLT